MDIYYDPSQFSNNYLNDQTYDFGSGGGEVLPIPEPSTNCMLVPDGHYLRVRSMVISAAAVAYHLVQAIL